MNRLSQFLWCAVSFLCALAGPLVVPQGAQAQTSRKPNIIVIVGDDMG